jgi:hypothetical protein
MTAPVQTRSERIATTVPVQPASANGHVAMRFFLPRATAEAGAPARLDRRLHLVQIRRRPPSPRWRYAGIST